MNSRYDAFKLGKLQDTLVDLDPLMSAASRLDLLVAAGMDRLPPPGGGATLARWQALAAVASTDLSLAKLYEGHTDALAIRAELEASDETQSNVGTWAVWAAEAPHGRTTIAEGGDGAARLQGAKCWCSGAASVDNALLTAWDADGRGPQLVSVALQQAGVRVSATAWQAVGMSGCASLDVAFDGARAQRIGKPGDYLRRPGFWQGGAGVAACWFGGALALAEALRNSLSAAPANANQPFRLAALGRVDVALRSTAAILRECAAWIDTHPAADARLVALRARLSAEQTATLVQDEVGRALGATPFCRDARFARMAADLPVFIRQSHADRDLAALGDQMLDAGATAWML
ncbi:MAG: acyl-CoA dehydrogenase family protein [Burkholderiaceae bacterium]